MSTVVNLKALGKAVGEVGATVAGIVANGSNYLADLVYLPAIVRDGEDVVAAVQNYKADLAEVTSLDEAGRADLAASWAADLPVTGTAADAVIQEGVTICTYVLEAVGYFLRTRAPAAPAA